MHVCVIIPTYNSSKFLAQAIDSVLENASPAFELEIVVVDDGSTDNTSEVARSYGSRIQFIAISHTGCPGAVRNCGLRATNAEYVAFLDSDDVCLPGRLSQQFAVIERKKADLAFCDCLEFRSGESARRSFMEKIGVTKRLHRELQDQILPNALEFLLQVGGLAPPSCVMARRKTLVDLGLFTEDLYASEDFDLYLRIAGVGRIAVDFTALTLRRLHSENTSASRVRLIYDGIAISEKLKKVSQIARNQRMMQLIERMEARWYREQGALHLENGNRYSARASWTISFRSRPSFRVACYWALSFLPINWLTALQRARAWSRTPRKNSMRLNNG